MQQMTERGCEKPRKLTEDMTEFQTEVDNKGYTPETVQISR